MKARKDSWKVLLLVGCLMSLVSSPAVHAQTNEEIGAALQFNLLPPGAKNLALAGAFTGLANDATTTYSNPAGMVLLADGEFLGEVRTQQFKTKYPFGGSASGQPTGIGIDTSPELELREFTQQATDLGFLAYVRKIGNRWRGAVFYHQFADYSAVLESEGPFIRNGGNEPAFNRSRLAALEGNLDLGIRSSGFALAFAPVPTIGIGLNVTIQQLDFSAETRRFDVSGPIRLTDGRIETSFTPADRSPGNETERSFQKSDDTALGWSIGTVYQNQANTFGLGAVARIAPTFDLEYSFLWGQRAATNAVARNNPDLIDPGVQRALTGTTDFHPPDVFAVGMFVQPARLHRRFLIAFDLAWVGYSNLTPKANLISTALRGAPVPGTTNTFGLATCGDFNREGVHYPTGSEVRDSVPCISPSLENFKIDDALEVHLGFQYRLPKAAVELRAGAWLDPDHQLFYDVDKIDIGQSEDRFALRFPKGEDEIHFTSGVGFEIKKAILDIGIDWSDRGYVVSVSLVKRLDLGSRGE